MVRCLLLGHVLSLHKTIDAGRWKEMAYGSYGNRLTRTGLGVWVVVFGVHVLTFCLVLPFVCRNWPYSVYFRDSPSEFLAEAIRRHDKRVEADSDYIGNLSSGRRLQYLDRLEGNHSRPDIVITIVTSVRATSDVGGGYVTQVMASFDRMLMAEPTHESKNVALFLCNVDRLPWRHLEAVWLSKYFPMVFRPDTTPRPRGVPNPEKQREDFIFCLESARRYKSRFIMLVEDDAVPERNLFPVLRRLLDTKIVRRWRHGELVADRKWGYVKLFYPERWRSYGSDLLTTTEVAAVSVIGGAVILCLFALCRGGVRGSNPGIIFLFGSVYFGLIHTLVGRPYMQQWRRLVPDLYAVVRSPECCMPSVLYPESTIRGLISYLKNTTCRSDPLDVVIHRYFSLRSYVNYLIEPNLFKHKGLYSSLKGLSQHPAMFVD